MFWLFLSLLIWFIWFCMNMVLGMKLAFDECNVDNWEDVRGSVQVIVYIVAGLGPIGTGLFLWGAIEIV